MGQEPGTEQRATAVGPEAGSGPPAAGRGKGDRRAGDRSAGAKGRQGG